MNKSEQINELAGALAKAQGAFPTILKSSDNPFFKSKYADLATIIDAVRKPLSDNGLSMVQLPVPTEKQEVCIETVLLHASGQWVSALMAVPVAKADAQGFGSATSYAKRYGAQAMLFVAAENEEDDGNAAAKAKPRPTEAEMMPRPNKPSVSYSDEARQKIAQQGIDRLTPIAEGTEAPVVGRAPEMQEHPNRISFKLKGANYSTAGMTAAQMLQSFDLVPVVDKRYGKDYCRELLKAEFGVVTRSDLTEEQGAQYLARLVELKEAE